MLYFRFETKKNIIYLLSLAEPTPHNIGIVWSDIFEKLMKIEPINRNLVFISTGYTEKFTTVKYSKFFNRFYTIIPKYEKPVRHIKINVYNKVSIRRKND